MINDIITTFLVSVGSIFMLIAAIGILRLPDFYLRMSAITKASTLGLGMVLLGVSIHFDQFGVFVKAFIIISFLLLTNPVGAHAIARAAYKQGVKFWGETIVDELELLSKKAENLEKEWQVNSSNFAIGEELIYTLMQLPASHGGSFRKALDLAKQIQLVNTPVGNRLLGIVYSKMGRFNEAEHYLKLASTECNFNQKAIFSLVDFYTENNLPNRALNVLEDAMQVHPQNIEFVFKAIYIAFDFGVSHKLGLACCDKIIAMGTDVSADYLLKAARYKRIFVERSIGKNY